MAEKCFGTGAKNDVIVGVGDVFVTKMYFTAMGDYEMHNRIVAFETDRCIAWEPGNPEYPKNGSCWRFELTPHGPSATMVTRKLLTARMPPRMSVRPWITARHGSLPWR